jgi:rRNA maturation endonuclease Nob1
MEDDDSDYAYYCEICENIVPDDLIKDDCCCPECGNMLRCMHIDDLQ